MGEEFSKKALERHRRGDGSAPLKCKKCVSEAEQAERDQAAARRKAAATAGSSDGAAGSTNSDDETRRCVGKCNKTLSKSAFNRNQWSKGDGKSRCRECVEQSLQEESEQQSKLKEEKLVAARKKVEDAKKGGNAQMIIAAESELAALEAERVTGLKPMKMSAGRGGGRGGRGGRYGSRGRGRGGRR